MAEMERDAGLSERFSRGDTRALSRAVTLIEQGDRRGQDLLRDVYPRSGQAVIYGVTGNPGAGKSTLVRSIARVLTQRGRSVAIIACDPTSPYTGGALLGDRIRMGRLFDDRKVYMRSLASRGHLGGLSLAVADVITLFDAFGFNVILIETVGTGQSEVEVAELADTTLVVLSPGFGDEIQASKAGVLEIADVYIVNKADLEGADAVVSELQDRLRSSRSADRHAADGEPRGRRSWLPPIVKTVATQGMGIEELTDHIEAHGRFLAESAWRTRVARYRSEKRLHELVSVMATRKIMREAELNGELQRTLDAMATRRIDPYSAASALLSSCSKPESGKATG